MCSTLGVLWQDEDEDGPSRRRKRSNFVDVEAAEDEAEEDDEDDEVGVSAEPDLIGCSCLLSSKPCMMAVGGYQGVSRMPCTDAVTDGPQTCSAMARQ